jgi:signal peptidase I
MSKEEKKRQKRVKQDLLERKLKRTWYGKFFYFIWYEDSFTSWVINIILAFIFIKFLFYPLLGVVFGTNLPVVAVVSCSMEHKFTNCGNDNIMNNLCGVPGSGGTNFDTFWDNCGEFYEAKGITKDVFKEFKMSGGFNKGDIIFLKGTNIDKLKIGDILVFDAKGRGYPIIHRVIQKDNSSSNNNVQTKGDHNIAQINDGLLNEYNVNESQFRGEAIFKVPLVGYIKIWFTDLVNMFR